MTTGAKLTAKGETQMAQEAESGALFQGGSFKIAKVEGYTVTSTKGVWYRFPRRVAPAGHHGNGHEWPKAGDTILASLDLPPIPGARAHAKVENGCGCELVIEFVSSPPPRFGKTTNREGAMPSAP